MSTLTEEQRRRIEENKRKAIEKRAAKVQQSVTICTPGNKTVFQQTSQNHHGLYSHTNFASNSSAHKFNSLEKQTTLTECLMLKNNVTSNIRVISSQASYKNSTSSNISQQSDSDNFIPGLSPNKHVVQGSCVLIARKRFMVDVCYHKQMIEIFKNMPSRVYDAKLRKWNFSTDDHEKLIEALKQLPHNVVISPLPKYLFNTFHKATERVEIKETDLSSLDPVLLAALLPFQKEGVHFGIQHKGRVLIADDMGLGKTIQAIAIASYFKNDWPMLVVTPSSVRYSWKEAFHVWLPSLDAQEITIVNSGKDNIPNNKVILMSYDLLSKKLSEINKSGFKSVIMDESHFLKNPKSARTKAAQAIMKRMNRIIMLTGTPALSRPVELYTQISALKPKFFPSFMDFGIRYCDGKKMPWGWDYSGSSNMEELQLLLEETVMIRRLKSEVIKQLPPKRRQMIVLDPSHVMSKSKVLVAMSREMNRINLKGMERRGVLLQYFHETGVVKLPAIREYIKDLLETDNKFLCFAHHQLVMDGICNAIEKQKCNYIRIDGSTSAELRKQNCDRFQLYDDCRVAVLSITAANAGITLTAAQLVVFAELFWNPGILTQAEDRAHRIGQEDSVVVQYLVAKGTADDHIWPLVQRKLDILNKAGLSKDNFTDADTMHARKFSQPLLEDFWAELSEDPEFWDDQAFPDVGIDEDPIPAKRSKSEYDL